MKDFNKQAPEATVGGGASPVVYRKAKGENPQSAGKPLCLPPNTSEEKFKQFTLQAAEICGLENVIFITNTDEFEHENYLDLSKAHDVFHVLDRQYFIASAVIMPRGVPSVQGIVKLCNEFEIPVWPFSIGRNIGYGGSAPRVPRSIGLDMGHHMNKIIEVNVGGAYALVEPGVTYFDLHENLVNNNLRD